MPEYKKLLLNISIFDFCFLLSQSARTSNISNIIFWYFILNHHLVEANKKCILVVEVDLIFKRRSYFYITERRLWERILLLIKFLLLLNVIILLYNHILTLKNTVSVCSYYFRGQRGISLVRYTQNLRTKR